MYNWKYCGGVSSHQPALSWPPAVHLENKAGQHCSAGQQGGATWLSQWQNFTEMGEKKVVEHETDLEK